MNGTLGHLQIHVLVGVNWAESLVDVDEFNGGGHGMKNSILTFIVFPAKAGTHSIGSGVHDFCRDDDLESERARNHVVWSALALLIQPGTCCPTYSREP